MYIQCSDIGGRLALAITNQQHELFIIYDDKVRQIKDINLSGAEVKI